MAGARAGHPNGPGVDREPAAFSDRGRLFFAGLAKINADWLLEALPLRIWLAARSDLPVAGPLLSQVWVAYAFSWFGMAYDLGIVFFLS